jgi:hypothetical protein
MVFPKNNLSVDYPKVFKKSIPVKESPVIAIEIE